MSVENLADPANVLVALSEPEACFYCSRPLTSPAVYWRTSEGSIALHPACAKTLGVKLIYDGERGERINRGDQLLAGIDPSFRKENDVA